MTSLKGKRLVDLYRRVWRNPCHARSNPPQAERLKSSATRWPRFTCRQSDEMRGVGASWRGHRGAIINAPPVMTKHPLEKPDHPVLPGAPSPHHAALPLDLVLLVCMRDECSERLVWIGTREPGLRVGGALGILRPFATARIARISAACSRHTDIKRGIGQGANARLRQIRTQTPASHSPATPRCGAAHPHPLDATPAGRTAVAPAAGQPSSARGPPVIQSVPAWSLGARVVAVGAVW